MNDKCNKCFKTFASISNLRKHIKKFHGNDVALKKLKYKVANLYPYNCQCGRNFSKKASLAYHVRNSHSSGIENKVPNPTQQCPLCPFCCTFEKDLLEHFKNKHEIVIDREKDLKWDSLDEFEKWKSDVENETGSRFVKLRSKSITSSRHVKYVCNRSGHYIPSVQNRRRHLKTQGSNKINAICPAGISLVINENGTCTCNFTKTHVGHNSDVGHLNLSSSERKICADKIASKVPLDTILDQVRDSGSDSNLQRLHLLSKKDLYNIKRSFNLCSDSVRHQNGAISVEAWVIEMNEEDSKSVLFYKPQDTVVQEHPELKEEDFLLIIMNKAQCEILKKYGSDCVCLDSTYGMNSYNLELTTLMVIDDMRQGFPCAFFLSNRLDKEVLKVFFSYVKIYSQNIAPRVFMTDIAEAFYNAWIEVMEKPVLRLYCTWHVDEAWRKNLPKIRIRDKQIEVYKFLRVLMEERDIASFSKMKDEWCTKLINDSSTREFAEYFINDFSKNCECWAYCFRLHSGIDTNIDLERMHRTLKHIYHNGKTVKRLDKVISAIMKFTKDRLFDRLIVINKGKITSKLRDIRQRHKTSLKFSTNLVIPSEDGWDMLSARKREVYHIKKENLNCKCQLVCSECNVCLHKYSCSCIDSAVKWVMCKHIHVLGRKLINDSLLNISDMDTEDKNHEESADLYILSDDEANTESEFLTSQISTKIKRVNDDEEYAVSKELEKLKQQILESLSRVKTMSQVEAIKKCIAPLNTKLQAFI